MMMMMMNNNNNSNNELHALSQVENEYKTTLANNLGIDPQSILNLSSNEIGKLISKHKKNKTLKNGKVNKKEIQKIIELKNENIKKQQSLIKQAIKKKKVKYSSDSNSDSSETESEQKSDTESVSANTSASESESNSESSDSVKPPKKQIKIAPVKKTKEITTPKEKTSIKSFVIKCDEIEKNPCHFNDYLVELKEQFNLKSIKSIKNITLEKIDIDFCANIDQTKNSLVLKIKQDKDSDHDSDNIDNSDNSDNIDNDNEEYKIHEVMFPNEKNTINELVNYFNEYCKNENLNILMKEKNGFITIMSQNKSQFMIDYSKNSIGYLFGFVNKSYSNSSKYIGEIRHAFNTKPIYIYLLNIDEKNPFAKINPNGKIEQLITKFNEFIDLNFIIQFRASNERDSDNDDEIDKELINLGCQSHKITLKLEYV
jgi:hypothetical protein